MRVRVSDGNLGPWQAAARDIVAAGVVELRVDDAQLEPNG